MSTILISPEDQELLHALLTEEKFINVAESLSWGLRKVNQHLKRLLHQYGARNKYDLLIMLSRIGIVETPTRKTPRFALQQQKILMLLARGYNEQEIMRELSLSRSNLEHQLENLMNKAKLATKCELAVWAAAAGFGEEAPSE